MTTRTGQRIRRRFARFGVLALMCASALLLTAGLSAAVAGPAPAAGPQLSITVDNGRTSVAKGDALDYTLTVRNLGTKKVAHLQITQSMPAGMSFRSADSGGTHRSGAVGWRVDLKAGAQMSLHSRATVTTTPDSLLRLATVACASESAKGPPIVCASHSDQLPAGAAAQAAVAGDSRSSTPFVPWLFALAGVVVVGAVAIVLVVRRRHRAIPA